VKKVIPPIITCRIPNINKSSLIATELHQLMDYVLYIITNKTFLHNAYLAKYFTADFDENFSWYLHSRSIDKHFTNGITNRNNLLIKLALIIFDLLVINLLINFQTNKARNFFLPALFCWYFPLDVYHITDRILYAILSVFLIFRR
jgi:hypothetical protein